MEHHNVHAARRKRSSRERQSLLTLLEHWFDVPMLVLGFVWLMLLVVELAAGLNPFLEALGTMIWVMFVLDFLVRYALAPAKLTYLRRNWLTAISLIVPALRLVRIASALRVLRLARAARGVRLVRILASVNRGMRALGSTMARRGIGYVVALTFIVSAAGAAGMYAFERDVQDPRGIHDVGSAVWWTAMIITTMGSEYWPRTAAGRLLCLLLATYAFAVFGYLTAALASHFVGRDAKLGDGAIAGEASIARLQREVFALREELRAALDRGPMPLSTQHASSPQSTGAA